jgi:hypothetical protein
MHRNIVSPFSWHYACASSTLKDHPTTSCTSTNHDKFFPILLDFANAEFELLIGLSPHSHPSRWPTKPPPLSWTSKSPRPCCESTGSMLTFNLQRHGFLEIGICWQRCSFMGLSYSNCDKGWGGSYNRRIRFRQTRRCEQAVIPYRWGRWRKPISQERNGGLGLLHWRRSSCRCKRAR